MGSIERRVKDSAMMCTVLWLIAIIVPNLLSTFFSLSSLDFNPQLCPSSWPYQSLVAENYGLVACLSSGRPPSSQYRLPDSPGWVWNLQGLKG